MKHARRHDALKERTYRERFAQRAEGYASEYRPIPVANGKLRHAGVDPDQDGESGSARI